MTALFVLMVLFQTGNSDSVWVKLEKGQALVLNPVNSEWIPVKEREQLPLRAVILTKPDTRLFVFQETNSFAAPAGSYFVLEDVIPREGNDLVRSLTHIEMSQIPPARPDGQKNRPIGITYGEKKESEVKTDIPWFSERITAVKEFEKTEAWSGALLSLKRLLIRFPDLYKQTELVNRLLSLYEKQELYGHLHDESGQLLLQKINDDYDQMVLKWNTLARKKLMEKAQPR